MILEKMIIRYNVLIELKDGLISKGYNFHKLSYINGQIELLEDLIAQESFNVLNELLKKTNYRLLKKIEKGHYHLASISNYSDAWFLCDVNENRNEWLNRDSLIFSTEKDLLAFTKNECGQKYINNKWQ